MMKRIICIVTILIFTTGLNAYTESNKSIQWQRIDLEGKLRQRISEFLGLILDKEKYFVEVQISASQPNLTLPKFEIPKDEKKKVVSGVKFTDEKNEKSKENAEYILFDKLGILSPLFETETQINSNNSELQIKFFQYKEKIERELIEKNDLFGLINSVDITLAFDTKMEDQKVKEIQGLVEKIIPKFGGVSAKIEVFKMGFYEKPAESKTGLAGKPIAEKPKEKTPIELIKENIQHLTGPVGTILATVLVCLSAFIMLAGLKRHQNALAQLSAASNANNDNNSDVDRASDVDQIDPDFRPGSPQLIEAISSEKEGIKKLFLYLEKSNDQACNLIKKWINLDSSLSNATLLMLSERMSIDELYQVFDKLTPEERESWIKVSSSNDITIDLKSQADSFIAQQVMEDIMTVSATDDNELQKLLVELTPEKASDISRNNPDHGALLVNLMSSSFLSQMYLKLETEILSEISLKGLKLTEETIKENSSELKQILQESVVKKYTNPFSRRVVEVINDLDPIRQENMISTLIDEKQIFIVKDIVKKIIPIQVIDNLPSEIIKEVVKDIKNEFRLEYIVSLGEDQRAKFIDSISQEGTKGREVLEFELDKFLEDEVAVSRIRKRSDEIKQEFISQARSIIVKNEEMKNQVFEIIDDWLKGLNDDTASQGIENEAA